MKDIDTLITSVVFKAAKLNPHSSKGIRLAELKHLVPFAGVCKVWRKSLLKHLYGIARVEHHYSMHSPPKNKSWYIASYRQAKVVWCWWESNIELIGSNRFCSIPTKLYIDMDYPRFFDKISPENVLTKLKLDMYEWPNVCSLYVNNVDGNCKATAINFCQKTSIAASNSGVTEELAERTVAYLKHFLPHINNLAIYCYYTDDPFIELLNGKIFNCYLQQLEGLSIFEPITLTTPVLPDSLLDIDLHLKPMDSFWFPRFNMDQIKYLYLQVNSSDFTWSRLLNSTNANIKLKELMHLYLCFKGSNYYNILSSSNSSRPLQLEEGLKPKTENLKPVSVLELPNIRSLSIYTATSNCLLFEPIIRLGDNAHIFLGGRVQELLNCTNIQYETATEYKTRIRELEPEEMDDFYALTNQLFGSFILAPEMTLNIGSYALIDLDAGMLQWFNLTKLGLNFDVKFNTVLDIVPQIPNLSYLYIDWMSAQDKEMCLLVDKGAENPGSELKTRIRELSVFEKKYVDRPKQPANPDVVVYMAKRMPLLKKLHVPAFVASEVKDEFLRQAIWYPHLQNVDI